MSSPTTELSLFHIERELLELMRLREEGLTEEEQAAVDQQIEAYVRAQVKKVDNVRAFLRHAETMASAAAEESLRYKKISEEWEAARKKVADYCIKVMQEFGEKKLTGSSGASLQVKANGGLQALTIIEETLLPQECFTARIKMPWPLWIKVQGACEWQEVKLEGAEVKSEVDTKAVRQKITELPEGSTLPGARLEPRGSRLEVK